MDAQTSCSPEDDDSAQNLAEKEEVLLIRISSMPWPNHTTILVWASKSHRRKWAAKNAAQSYHQISMFTCLSIFEAIKPASAESHLAVKRRREVQQQFHCIPSWQYCLWAHCWSMDLASHETRRRQMRNRIFLAYRWLKCPAKAVSFSLIDMPTDTIIGSVGQILRHILLSIDHWPCHDVCTVGHRASLNEACKKGLWRTFSHSGHHSLGTINYIGPAHSSWPARHCHRNK